MRSVLVLLFLATAQISFSQFQGPVPKITTGYGSDGTQNVTVTSISNAHYSTKNILVFHPTGTSSVIPTIFYSHGYGGNDTTNQVENLKHFAAKGYAVVFVPYKSFGVTHAERYLTLFDGFVKAAKTLPAIIDTTRIGFYGHSYGAGATPRVSYRIFKEKNWGINGKFIYCSAPWYSLELGTTNLSNFPSDCKMLTVLYDKDATNDHRMGMDIFKNIAIHDSLKDCITVYPDTVGSYIYTAGHNLPSQYGGSRKFDAYDYYVTFRLIEALADYTFTGNVTAKNIALGNGNASQINMGTQLKNIFSTNSPSPVYAESNHLFRCSSTQNERRSFCPQIIGLEENIFDDISVFPNPTSGIINVKLSDNKLIKIELLSSLGQVLISNLNNKLDLSSFENGVYFLRIYTGKGVLVSKVIKE